MEPAKEQEDALAQTRQALIEEDLKKQSRFLEKAKRRLRKKPTVAELGKEKEAKAEESTAAKAGIPPSEEAPVERLLAEKEEEPKPELPSEQAPTDEADLVGLLDMLSGVQESAEIIPNAAEPTEAAAEVKAPPPAQDEGGKEPSAPHISAKEALKMRPPEEKSLEVTSLRDVALQDYAEPPKENARVHRKNFWDQFDEKLSGERFTAIVRVVSLGILAIAVAIVAIIFVILRGRTTAVQQRLYFYSLKIIETKTTITG